MLILTRTADQKIVVAEGLVVITVLDIRFRKGFKPSVRLGIDAPKEMTIHREEIQKEIDQQKTEG